MSRFAYVNGSYIPHRNAAVHIEDRGYQFGDGVYEVVLLIDGKMADCDGHLKRLNRSLGELQIKSPVADSAMRQIMARIIRLNCLKTGIIYIQITRGVASRNHAFPRHSTANMIMTVKHVSVDTSRQIDGKSAITVPDQRWERRDIKTIQLLPNCLAKQAASEQGAYEAIMVMPDGSVSEGSSSNVWILNNKNQLITRQADVDILNGITRRSIQRIAGELQIEIIERSFSVTEMMQAKEVFVTSATSMVTALTLIDGKKIDEGRVGLIASALKADYIKYVQTGSY